MSDTRKAERAERAEDERGNVQGARLSWQEAHEEWLERVWALEGTLHPEAPTDERKRNELILKVVADAAKERSHWDLARLLESTTDVFGVLHVLAEQGLPIYESDPVRFAICAELETMRCWNDELMRELAGDACMVWGTGDADAVLLLEDDWTEFRVSWRVAMQEGSR